MPSRAVVCALASAFALGALAGCLSGPPAPVGPPADNATNGTGNGTVPPTSEEPDAGGDAAGDGPADPPDDEADPEPSAWPRAGSTATYAMRFGMSLPGGDSGTYYERVTWTNATLTFDGSRWTGTCRADSREFRDGEGWSWRTESASLDLAPLRESTDVAVGDSVDVEFLRGCEVHRTTLIVQERTERDGRAAWVALSPRDETEYHDEAAWWDAETGLTLGWSLLRLRSNDRGSAETA